MTALIVSLCLGASPALADDMPVVSINVRSLPYDQSPTSYKNAPTNYSNALTNYENAGSNYENAQTYYQNAASKATGSTTHRAVHLRESCSASSDGSRCASMKR
ncbi:MAG: hypothetical protein EB084_19235 [Proteobacteria bacterium]|nr:hypothetical protein [Pseudomonadota bacterium]